MKSACLTGNSVSPRLSGMVFVKPCTYCTWKPWITQQIYSILLWKDLMTYECLMCPSTSPVGIRTVRDGEAHGQKTGEEQFPGRSSSMMKLLLKLLMTFKYAGLELPNRAWRHPLSDLTGTNIWWKSEWRLRCIARVGTLVLWLLSGACHGLTGFTGLYQIRKWVGFWPGLVKINKALVLGSHWFSRFLIWNLGKLHHFKIGKGHYPFRS